MGKLRRPAACKGRHVDAESPKAMAGIEVQRMTRAGAHVSEQ